MRPLPFLLLATLLLPACRDKGEPGTDPGTDTGSLEGCESPLTFYTDADGDGHGDPESATAACEPPEGAVEQGGDCNDRDEAVHPGATEDCNEIDDDCDGETDEDGLAPWYLDADGDGFGTERFTVEACAPPDGYVDNTDDCDDLDAATWPGAPEVCDEADNDCDDEVDEDALSTFYADLDGDGYGDATAATEACDLPVGYSTRSGDCDDDDPSARPGGLEICDESDNDCDGDTDEDALDADAWYADADGDGFGDPDASIDACSVPSGHVDNARDCDDSSFDINPSADEVCDTVDNDCDGSTDEASAIDASIWYADVDGDGYGDPLVTTLACTRPSAHTDDSTDCDDRDATVSPAASELCDSIDNDCDGTTDESAATDASSWYPDDDGDGHGDASATATVACDAPSGHVSTSDDCDDTLDDIHPGAIETCDEADEDCDGTIDDPAELLGSEALCAALDCDDVLASRSGATDGLYWMDPDATGNAFEAYCDLGSSGGPHGWLVDPGDLDAYWTFDGSDATADEIAGYAGSAEGATTRTNTVPASGFDQSVHFTNDESSRITLSSGPTLGSTWTISFWTRHDSCSNNQIPLLFSDNSSYMGDLHYQGSFYGNSTTIFHSSSSVCTSWIDTWVHHVYRDDGSTLRVWVNGTEVSPVTYSYRTTSGLTLNRFGARPGFGTNGLAGYLDDVAVFGRALDTDEIALLYEQGLLGRPLRW